MKILTRTAKAVLIFSYTQDWELMVVHKNFSIYSSNCMADLFCYFQNFRLIFFSFFFILILASHSQQNKQCLAAHAGSNLAVPTVSETPGCYVYCFFVQYLMLYFARANIIIKGGKQYAVNIFFLRYVHQFARF